jgi:hypothetical protein
MVSNLIGKQAICYYSGEEFAEGEIVYVERLTIWLKMDSGFIVQCNPGSVKVLETKVEPTYRSVYEEGY